MNSKVTVTADAAGCIIGVSNKNPEYGFIRVVQQRMLINNEGWVRLTTLSALIRGKVSDLQALNLKADQELPGKIVIREQLDPFNKQNPDRNMKIAGDSGIPCCYHGAPIYRDNFFVTSSDAEDQLIAHTNVEEIKAEQYRLKKGTPIHELIKGSQIERAAVL